MKTKLLRIGLALMALAVTVVVLGYAAVNWWGARVWAETEARLQALGEPLTVAEIGAEPIPDELNFAAAPVFTELFAKPWGESRVSSIPSYVGGGGPGDSPIVRVAKSVDPEFSGSDGEAARLVLDDAESVKLIWDEIRSACERPGTAWPFDLAAGFPIESSALNGMLTLGQSLGMQIRAHLIVGDSASAARDLELLMNLSERVREPKVLINHLVRLSMVSMVLSGIETGIELSAWRPEDLERMAALLDSVDLIHELQTTLRGERVLIQNILSQVAEDGFGALQGPGEGGEAISAMMRFVPKGLILGARRDSAEDLQGLIEALGDRTALVSSVNRIEDQWAREKDSPVRFARLPLSDASRPALDSTLRRSVYFQSQVEMTVVACAIELFRLRNGRLPTALDELATEVPVDFISGEAFRYRVDGRGVGFLLYGVGWNLVDDGGSEARPSPKASVDAQDWVWVAW